MRYTYHGERVPKGIPVCVWEGFVDGATLSSRDQLYRHPWYKRLGWSVGYFMGKR
jgi:hypothetical protein